MTDIFDEDDMLAAEYAMGLLSGEAHVAARSRVVTDSAFAARVVGWEVQLSQMADLDPVAPPSGARDALLQRLFPETAPVPLWKRLGLWQALTGGALAVAVALAVVDLGPVVPSSLGPLYTAEITSDGGDFRVIALVDKTTNEILLTRTAGAAPAGRILQVWAHGPGEPAQSVGIWPDGESVVLPLPTEIAAVRGTLTLGISEEPPGGSPTGRPSGRVFGTVDVPGVTDPRT
ncbi:anti-sigma-K factor RskA [Roseovarius sp. MBR-51]